MLKVCETTGIGMGALQPRLKKLGLCRSNKQNSRKFTVNHNYFSNINTEQKAYWLGFIYADGYISRTKYGKYFGIALSEKDLNHLEKLKKDLNATYPIKHYINKFCFDIKTKFVYVRLLIASDQIFNDLSNNGVIEHKTLVLTFPSKEIVPDHLIHHFVRGYFDGDGCWSKNKGEFAFKLCGTSSFLKSIAEKIGFPNAKLYTRWPERNVDNHSLSIGGRQQCLNIGKYMYKESTIHLERKYNRFNLMLENNHKLRRKLISQSE